MPTLKFDGSFQIGPDADQKDVVDHLAKLTKTLNYALNHLDDDNVRRLYTNYCQIKSEGGETEIDGPLLVMKAAGSTTIRLLAGYASSTGDFVFSLYNEDGAQTVGINSTGDATFTGEITGSVVTGGTIQTATSGSVRIALSSGTLAGYTAGGDKIGLCFDINPLLTTNIADVGFWHNNTKTMEFADLLIAYAIRPTTDATGLIIGSTKTGAPAVYGVGIWEFSGDIGFFGSTSRSKTAVSNLSTAATLAGTIDKLNELIDALQSYGLV